jgi:hypothetical protein
VITIDVEAIDDALKQIGDSGGSTVARVTRSRMARLPTSRTRRAMCSAYGRNTP